MKLILALGNHPPRYQKTRHNIGFIALNRWALTHNLSFSHSELYDYIVYRQVVAIKPRTFMNLVEKALKEVLLRWKISEILVLHDDIELAPAHLRIRSGGGDGGHNGLKSLFNVMPPSDLKRIRIGIGRSQSLPADKYVLDEFADEELAAYDESLSLVSRFLDTYVSDDFNAMLNEYSKWKKSYSDGKNVGIKSPKEEKDD
ncbi:MAG: aminoacyl-tRNA hydrolase [Candidatus Cloacimonetes bacterium]|jgi:PTH1 family peptidyl-tRNA hydrolase|nr:aminoacyl-tRNA hydrolase [Candidatus Cloacimonadota bacterium]MDD2506542.1 aminoacyl-tRNA hydrolase [Candidatus Cloacimonadota bacterium]MDD4147740.1 aminoacyl-tRNA hydrolase [Candidatus Cloacimonadota bacterium]MDD4559413.1 aminoacyl-tRNA hydrolase [Candidatus Cloacimonadota bacterium]